MRDAPALQTFAGVCEAVKDAEQQQQAGEESEVEHGCSPEGTPETLIPPAVNFIDVDQSPAVKSA